jgi:hypothetical protein
MAAAIASPVTSAERPSAHGPIEQRVVTAGQDRRGIEPRLGFLPVSLGGQPAFQLAPRKQPLAAKLGGRHAVRACQFVKRALGQA